MRTLVISDLHLGGSTQVDVLQHEDARGPLLEEVARTDRLVLLGDVLELRHGPARAALEAARPVLEALGGALRDGAPVVVVPGNHDHALASPWLDHLARPLGLERRVSPARASGLARRLAGWLGTGKVEVAYPGVWLRDDVYATHGHYLDPHGTVPTFERLAAGAMQRLAGKLPPDEATAEDYERVLAPLYAWTYAAAQRARDGRVGAGAGHAKKAYELLEGDGHRPVRLRLLASAFPLGIRGLNLLGIGPLSSDISPDALRRNALDAMGEALRRLGVEAEHVVFGHSHRAGPLAGDDVTEWRTDGGSWLYNCGNWVHEGPFLAGSGEESPYWPGSAVVVEADGPPQVLRLPAPRPPQDEVEDAAEEAEEGPVAGADGLAEDEPGP